jgi:hypothetical protein
MIREQRRPTGQQGGVSDLETDGQPKRNSCESARTYGDEPRTVEEWSAHRRRAAGRGIRSANDWPYGPRAYLRMQVALLEWAERYDLRLAHGRERHYRLLRFRTCCHRSPVCPVCRPWLDHVSYWNRRGKTALVLAQPYHLSPTGLADLARLAQRPELYVALPGPGWYGCGTTAIEVWSREVWEQLGDQGGSQ